MIRKKALLVASAIAAIYSAGPARSQVQRHDTVLPLDLAVEAASEAVHVCAERGWPVTATLVDTDGVIRVQLKGDHSTIHTRDSSFRKAYTQVTLGPVFGFDRLSAGIEKLSANPNAPALASLPNVLLLAGAVAVTIDGETIGALAVGGAPGGDKDETCAAAGLMRIAARLPHRSGIWEQQP